MNKESDHVVLDCKGLSCPMPIVNIGRALRKMSVGQIIEVEADDPAFKDDLIAFVKHLNNTLLSIEEGTVTKALIRKEQ